jgi:hypothetical protein
MKRIPGDHLLVGGLHSTPEGHGLNPQRLAETAEFIRGASSVRGSMVRAAAGF